MHRFYFICAWALMLVSVAFNVTGDVARAQLSILTAILFALFAIYTDNKEVQ